MDKRVAARFKDPDVQIIDKDGRVHMARIDIHYGFSVNGVAAIHTEILKNTELNAFYKIYPEKFNNKTNGITFRRWLLCCNRELAGFLTEQIRAGYKKDARKLEKLLNYKDNPDVLDRLEQIKRTKKQQLVDYVEQKEGIHLNPDSIFDIQVKRLQQFHRIIYILLIKLLKLISVLRFILIVVQKRLRTFYLKITIHIILYFLKNL